MSFSFPALRPWHTPRFDIRAELRIPGPTGIAVDKAQRTTYHLNVAKAEVPQSIYHNGAVSHYSEIHNSIENAIFPEPPVSFSHSAT